MKSILSVVLFKWRVSELCSLLSTCIRLGLLSTRMCCAHPLAHARAAIQMINLIFLAREFQHPRSSLPYWFSLLLRCGLLMCSWML